jgi:hypothetical protein
MTDSPGFLKKAPDELEGFLVELARHDRAPTAARERAVSRVLAVSGAVGVAASTTASAAASAGQAGASWLAAKWFAIGLGTALGTLGVAERLQRGERHQPSLQLVSVVSATVPLGPVSAKPLPALTTSVVPSAVAPLPARPAAVPSPTGSREIGLTAPREAAGHFEAPSLDQLSRELAALKRARSALAGGNAAQATLALDQYRTQFPDGVLATEAAALEVETAKSLGEHARAAALARAFLRDHPTSPLSSRVRAVLEASTKP